VARLKVQKKWGIMGLPIKRGIEAIAGGMVMVPLSLGAVIGTFAPGTAQFFGSFTGALFTSALPILAVFYVCMGATIPFEILSGGRQGWCAAAAKVLMGVAAALVGRHLLGTEPGAGRPLHPGRGRRTILVAASVVATMLTVPLVTARWAKRITT
jgi:hypothetical protein